MKTEPTAFLIYRPAMDYEESIRPYFICSTERKAKLAEKAMCDFAAALVEKMPEYPEDDEDPGDLIYAERSDQRAAIIREAKWPFGIDLSSDFEGFSRLSFNPSCVDIMPLPLNPPA